MAGLDPVRLAKTIGVLLRKGAAGGGVSPDAQGYVAAPELARVLAALIHRLVRPDDVLTAVSRHGDGRFEVDEGRVRLRAQTPSTAWGSPSPDILYHATSAEAVEAHREEGQVASRHGGPVHLSRTEGQAWRVGHRQWEDPFVLIIDACRARRDGTQFSPVRPGQYCADRIPLRHVLNLREGFAEQTSAGGFLVDWSRGAPRIALIRVARRTQSTWEVAKGKIESGETPDVAARREVQEEMGVDAPVRVARSLGTVRYGFSTPEGDPRLKTIYLYVLETDREVEQFSPARREGIDAVQWFELEEAIHALAHPSLRASIGRLVEALEDRAAELGVPLYR